MTQEQIKDVLDKHKKWLNDEEGGERANLSYANLSWADLREADLREADLIWANLRRANLRRANLRGANLSGADLSGADLIGADLSRANLSGANLSRANLSGANLSRADLREASLYEADLRGADLRGAALSLANLSGANLSGANLSGADGLLFAAEYMAKNFECDDDGYIVYRAQNGNNKHPDHWVFEHGKFLTEAPNPDRCTPCGCGVAFATLKWVKENHKPPYWRCRINWRDLIDTVIPYNTDGKGRCARLELLEIVEE